MVHDNLDMVPDSCWFEILFSNAVWCSPVYNSCRRSDHISSVLLAFSVNRHRPRRLNQTSHPDLQHFWEVNPFRMPMSLLLLMVCELVVYETWYEIQVDIVIRNGVSCRVYWIDIGCGHCRLVVLQQMMTSCCSIRWRQVVIFSYSGWKNQTQYTWWIFKAIFIKNIIHTISLVNFGFKLIKFFTSVSSLCKK